MCYDLHDCLLKAKYKNTLSSLDFTWYTIVQCKIWRLHEINFVSWKFVAAESEKNKEIRPQSLLAGGTTKHSYSGTDANVTVNILH